MNNLISAKSTLPPLIFVILYLLITLGAYFISPEILKAQTLAIIFTGVVIIFYTWETYKLRSETQRQTELQNLPFVTLKTDHRGIILQNIGKGPAINIHIDNFYHDPEIEYKFEFSNLDMLKEGEEKIILGENYVSNHITRKTIFGDEGSFNPNSIDKEREVKINFQSIDMVSYSIVQKIIPKKPYEFSLIRNK